MVLGTAIVLDVSSYFGYWMLALIERIAGGASKGVWDDIIGYMDR